MCFAEKKWLPLQGLSFPRMRRRFKGFVTRSCQCSLTRTTKSLVSELQETCGIYNRPGGNFPVIFLGLKLLMLGIFGA